MNPSVSWYALYLIIISRTYLDVKSTNKTLFLKVVNKSLGVEDVIGSKTDKIQQFQAMQVAYATRRLPCLIRTFLFNRAVYGISESTFLYGNA